jgi:hypothetical protein
MIRRKALFFVFIERTLILKILFPEYEELLDILMKKIARIAKKKAPEHKGQEHLKDRKKHDHVSFLIG